MGPRPLTEEGPAPRPRRPRLRSRPAPPAPLLRLPTASSRVLASLRRSLPLSDAGHPGPRLPSAGSPGPRPSLPLPPRGCPGSPKDASLPCRRRSLRWRPGRSTESWCVTGPGAGPRSSRCAAPSPSARFPVTPSRPQRPPSRCKGVPAPPRSASPTVQGGALLSLGEPGTGTPEKANGSKGNAPFREHRFAGAEGESWRSRNPQTWIW